MKVSVQAQEEAKEAQQSRKELGLEDRVENLKALIQVTRQAPPTGPDCILLGMYFHGVFFPSLSFIVQLHIFLGFENALQSYHHHPHVVQL